MEILDIVDENGIPTGRTISREQAHLTGVRHRTSHVWLLRQRPDGVEVLLQKRSRIKDSHPGAYDISSAGHIPAGQDFITSALRELKEELGIEACPEDLYFCGQRRIYSEHEFYGKPFLDNQISNVYCIWMDREPEQMMLQEEEVEEVVWINLEQCKRQVSQNEFPTCIAPEELDMLPTDLLTVFG